jgi:hypothetical protein
MAKIILDLLDDAHGAGEYSKLCVTRGDQICCTPAICRHALCSSSRNYSRHPWRSRCAPPPAFAFAVLQTQSGSATKSRGGPGMTSKNLSFTNELEVE